MERSTQRIVFASMGMGPRALGLFALFSSPIIHAIMGSVDRRYVGVAAATSSTMRVSGQSFSMGIASLVLAVVVGRHMITTADHVHLLTSVHMLFLFFAPLCVLGVMASLVGSRRRKGAEGAPGEA